MPFDTSRRNANVETVLSNAWRVVRQVRDLHERCQKLGLSVAFKVDHPPLDKAGKTQGAPWTTTQTQQDGICVSLHDL